LTGDSVLMIR